MKKNSSKKTKEVKNNKLAEKSKKIAKILLIGIILFAMVFTSFSYLIYAMQSV